jgi:hypothetical protein
MHWIRISLSNMGGNYPNDVAGSEDHRLSSLRSSLISPNPAYLAQQQQAQQQWLQADNHTSSWNTADTSFDFNNQYPHYQQEQQWVAGQYTQSDKHRLTPSQSSYWGGYDTQGDQGFASSRLDMMAVDQTNADLQSKNNKVRIRSTFSVLSLCLYFCLWAKEKANLWNLSILGRDWCQYPKKQLPIIQETRRFW